MAGLVPAIHDWQRLNKGKSWVAGKPGQDAVGTTVPQPGFAVDGHTLGIRKPVQCFTKDRFQACVYAVTGVPGASMTARSCFGIGIPSFFSNSASAPAIFVR